MEAARAIAAKRELQERVKELQDDFKREQESTQDITASMTLQYKSMQEGLMNRITTLERTITDLRDQLGELGATGQRARRCSLSGPFVLRPQDHPATTTHQHLDPPPPPLPPPSCACCAQSFLAWRWRK